MCDRYHFFLRAANTEVAKNRPNRTIYLFLKINRPYLLLFTHMFLFPPKAILPKDTISYLTDESLDKVNTETFSTIY